MFSLVGCRIGVCIGTIAVTANTAFIVTITIVEAGLIHATVDIAVETATNIIGAKTGIVGIVGIMNTHNFSFGW